MNVLSSVSLHAIALKTLKEKVHTLLMFHQRLQQVFR